MYNPSEIETIVTVQYRTPDGVVHDTLAEALEHTPIYHPKYKMFGTNKDESVFETNNTATATFIYCPDNCSAEDFVNDCQDAGCITDGINGKGWYVWDENNYAWVRMPEGTTSLFENFLF